eukprot:CAMPEP_0182536688 /NCGR_PEP_ID=MMETSP1323-20130603/20593_1 /TAXON_ID=236787 /ORGANISM="Florenciella parvula, Strain RCC1693" /LENGTH=115 /DNA_ID=CAMNT_0024746959 /DNA_START=416 /DNA_END=759 /DNA_ORIENTATION=-
MERGGLGARKRSRRIPLASAPIAVFFQALLALVKQLRGLDRAVFGGYRLRTRDVDHDTVFRVLCVNSPDRRGASVQPFLFLVVPKHFEGLAAYPALARLLASLDDARFASFSLAL